MIKKHLAHKWVRLYNLIFILMLSGYAIRKIYLVSHSPFKFKDREGYSLLYYSPRAAVLVFLCLLIVLILSNILFYLMARKMKRV